MKFYFLSTLILLCSFSFGQDLNSIYKESMEAHSNQDYGKFVALNKEALKLHPSQPTILYNLAAGYSLTNSLQDTYQILRNLLSWNNTIGYKKDTDFNNLLSSDKYSGTLDSLVKSYGRAIRTGKEYALFIGKRHLEDLIVLDSLLFATDVYYGELISYNIKNKKVEVIKEFDLPVLAIASNSDPESIWVSTAKISQSKKKGGQSSAPEIIEIDALKGKVKSRIPLENDVVAGSMTFDKQGDLYVSNSSKPEVIIIDAKAKTIKNKIPMDDGFNLQGITVDLDKNIMYIADYIKGIVRVDIEDNHQVTWLESKNFLLKGIDGLTYIKDNQLIAVQNNSTPKRVFKIKTKGMAVDTVTFLDNNLDTDGEPTNGKYFEKLGFLYISNSPWPHYDKNGEAIMENWEDQKILLINLESFLEDRL